MGTGFNDGLTVDISEGSATPQPHVVKVSATAPIGGDVVEVQAVADPKQPTVDPKDAMITSLMEQIKAANAALEAAQREKDAPFEALPGVATVSKSSSKERWAIIIEEGQNENDMSEVHVGVNGRAYQIKRGEVAEVPREVISVLNDAVVSKTVASTVEIGGLQFTTGHTVRHSRRFPFRVLGKVIDSNGERMSKFEAQDGLEDLKL